jgi:death-on-curing protein
MRYLSPSEVIGINEQEVGPASWPILDYLRRPSFGPQQSVFGADAYPDIHTKAAALMHSLIRNHPFLDGNKRTAVLSVIVFYNLNGYAIDAAQGEVVALAVDVAEGQVDVEGIAGVLKDWSRELELPTD